jgi:predicted dehydrogenase
MNSYVVEAEKGWFRLAPAYGYTGNQGRRSDALAINMPPVDQFAAEMDDFAQCIMGNRTSIVSGEEGLRDVKIMMAIYDAAKNRLPTVVL